MPRAGEAHHLSRYQNLVYSVAFALGGLFGREWPGVEWRLDPFMRSGETPGSGSGSGLGLG